MAHRHICLQTT